MEVELHLIRDYHDCANADEYHANGDEGQNRDSDDIAGMVKSIKSMWQEPDKRKHFIAGFIISLVVGIFNPLLGLFAGSVAAFIKEWWDSKGHGTVELYDIIFTILGALSGCPFAIIINHLIF